MRFANAYFLVLAAIVPLAGLWWSFLRARREKALSKITLDVPKTRFSAVQTALILAGLFLAFVAAARPQWGRTAERTVQRSRNVVIAIDVSRSMLSRDVMPDRLERAKADVSDLIESLSGDRCALVAFRQTGELVCPLTADYAYLQSALDKISIDSAGGTETSLGAAIRKSLDALDPAADDHNVIIMITDGGDVAGLTDEQIRAGVPLSPDSLEAVRLAKSRGVLIFTVGIGNPKTASTIPGENGRGPQKYRDEVVRVKLMEKALREIAEKTGGRYVPLATAGTVETTLGAIYKRFLRNVAAKEQNEEAERAAERYALFLVPALAFLLAGASFSKGRFRKDRKMV